MYMDTMMMDKFDSLTFDKLSEIVGEMQHMTLVMELDK